MQQKLNLKNKKIAVIGLGYVGLPLAVEFGKKRETYGFDIDKKRIEELVSYFDKTKDCTHKQIKSAVNLRFSNDEKIFKK